MEIKRITWRSSSGMCAMNNAYNDKLSITETAVSYNFEPFEPTPENREINWMYTSDALAFRDLFRKVAANVEDILSHPQNVMVMDGGEWNLEVLYEDGHVETANFTCPGQTLTAYLESLKGFVPALEKMPRLFETAAEAFAETQDDD